MPLRVDVGEHGDKEGGGVPLREELPAAGLAELQERAGEGGEHRDPLPPRACPRAGTGLGLSCASGAVPAGSVLGAPPDGVWLGVG